MKNETHDYSKLVLGRDYVFDRLNEGKGGYMTGIGKAIKSGDYIILRHGSQVYQYQVEEIDYYPHSPNMYIALLGSPIEKKINSQIFYKLKTTMSTYIILFAQWLDYI
ncbi:MAG: hypothetical protein KME40_33570 [Komarekiella atlantica HA4396-MV6]|nr:hypothetical protein [Komarekiella atlantica HA4396-MV6]